MFELFILSFIGIAFVFAIGFWVGMAIQAEVVQQLRVSQSTLKDCSEEVLEKLKAARDEISRLRNEKV